MPKPSPQNQYNKTMDDTPLVSIITPSYNQDAYLEHTILSVLYQDYPNLEYWVMDGGSTDSSIRILNKYSQRLTGWVSEKDGGQADGINKGLSQAKGGIVAWLNSDDVYLPGAIQGAVEAFQKYPTAPFVYSDVNSIDEKGRFFHRMRYGDWGLKDLMTFHIIGQPSVFMRREALESAGYLNTGLQYLLDHELWLRLAALGEPRHIPGVVWASARVHAGAKNVAQAEGFGPEAYQIARWIGTEKRFYPMNARFRKRIWAGAHRLNAFYLVEAGKPKDALRMYRESAHLNPLVALKDWRRIAYAAISALGVRNARKPFDWLRLKLRGHRAKANKEA